MRATRTWAFWTGTGLLVLTLGAVPALAAECPPAAAGAATATGRLAATGLLGVLPVVGLALLVVALVCRRLDRTSGAAAASVALVVVAAGLGLSGSGSARAQECPPAASPVSAAPAPTGPPSTYLVGAAVESINPSPELIASKQVFLGGYGLSSGTVGGAVPLFDGRFATGILGEGVSSRALAVSDGTTAIVTAQIETQGVFAAYKIGPYGLEDMRRMAAEQVQALRPDGPELGPGQIVIDSNHSHAGPDTAGVWGGVPEEYLAFIRDQTVKAIVRAYTSMVPAQIRYGTAKGGVNVLDEGALISNQFADDPRNQTMDDELRVLQATDARTGEVVVTYLNWSAHTTVLGGGNTLVSADYTGPLSAKLASLGGVGFHQVGTLGRSQPAGRGCADESLEGEAESTCALEEYAGRVFERTQQALAAATPLTGDPVVAMHSYLISDVTTNVPIYALSNGGFALGAPILRQTTPPWFTGNVVGTTTFSGRIGDLLLSGAPGEPYPQIPQAVRDALPGMRGYLSLGTAGDFLGYLIAPADAYPEPIRRSLLSASRRRPGTTARASRRRSAARARSTTTRSSSTPRSRSASGSSARCCGAQGRSPERAPHRGTPGRAAACSPTTCCCRLTPTPPSTPARTAPSAEPARPAHQSRKHCPRPAAASPRRSPGAKPVSVEVLCISCAGSSTWPSPTRCASSCRSTERSRASPSGPARSSARSAVSRTTSPFTRRSSPGRPGGAHVVPPPRATVPASRPLRSCSDDQATSAGAKLPSGRRSARSSSPGSGPVTSGWRTRSRPVSRATSATASTSSASAPGSSPSRRTANGTGRHGSNSTGRPVASRRRSAKACGPSTPGSGGSGTSRDGPACEASSIQVAGPAVLGRQPAHRGDQQAEARGDAAPGDGYSLRAPLARAPR
jgi:hypothetical protein